MAVGEVDLRKLPKRSEKNKTACGLLLCDGGVSDSVVISVKYNFIFLSILYILTNTWILK